MVVNTLIHVLPWTAANTANTIPTNKAIMADISIKEIVQDVLFEYGTFTNRSISFAIGVGSPPTDWVSAAIVPIAWEYNRVSLIDKSLLSYSLVSC